MKNNLTARQKFVFEYLKKKGETFTSPTEVGFEYGKTINLLITHHSSTGSPICKQLVSLGLAERNKKGWYRIVESER